MSLVIENEFNNSVFFIFSCCLAMGLQNSLTSKYSGSVVRTTHLTGASTDLVRSCLYALQACVMLWRHWRESGQAANACSYKTQHTTRAQGIALGHIIKGRSEEWWKVKLHTTALFGFFCGGFCGYYAFRVRGQRKGRVARSVIGDSLCEKGRGWGRGEVCVI